MIEPAHIVVVDDDADIRRLMQLLLHDAGYRVSPLASGEEALAFLQLVTPDLILLDLSLPGVDGLAVAAAVKADPTLPFIPIIMVTARADLASKITGLDAGADDFLVKPVDFGELLARVRAMLRLQRAQRSLQAEKRKTELLLDLTRELSSELDLNVLLSRFLTHLSDVVGAVRGSIILPGQPNQADGSQPQFYSTSRKPMLLPLADLLRHGVAGWVLREREPLVIADTHHDERWIGNDLHQRSIHSVAAAPILNERDVLGVITLVHHTPNYFQNEHLELLRSVAAQSATALEKAQLFRVVNEQNDLLEQLFRRAEEERSTLNAVLRSAADPILMIGPQEEVLLANPAAETRLLLDAPEQRQGRRLRELLPPTVRHHLFGAEGQEPLAQSRSNEVVLPDASTLVVSVAPVRAVDGQLLGQVATFQDITAIKELERQRFEQMQGVLRRYVSPSVVDELLKRGADAFGSPEERDVAVLFADLRGYTALAEGLDPHVLVEQVLNRYFRAMTEVLYSYDGTIDKFLGDGVIGAFGTPLARHDDIQRALHAVVDMQRAFARLQGLWRAELDLDIGMGIGLSYGRAVVGNIGSDQHLDYTLVGDVVNTASRLSSIAAPGQIIVSHQLIERLPPHWSAPWPLRCLPPVRLKNKRDPHLVYQIEYTADAAVLDRS